MKNESKVGIEPRGWIPPETNWNPFGIAATSDDVPQTSKAVVDEKAYMQMLCEAWLQPTRAAMTDDLRKQIAALDGKDHTLKKELQAKLTWYFMGNRNCP